MTFPLAAPCIQAGAAAIAVVLAGMALTSCTAKQADTPSAGNTPAAVISVNASDAECANVNGSQTAVASVRPILDERNADLGHKVDQRFSEVEALLGGYRSGDGYVSYASVSQPQRQELSRTLDALSNEVSQVQGVVAPR